MGIEVDQAARTVTVTAPAVGIISRSIDPKSISFYSQDTGLFESFDPKDVTAFQSAQLDAFTSAAIDNGVLELATTHAREFLSSQVATVLAQLGAADYTVEVVIPDPDRKDALAQATAPAGSGT